MMAFRSTSVFLVYCGGTGDSGDSCPGSSCSRAKCACSSCAFAEFMAVVLLLYHQTIEQRIHMQVLRFRLCEQMHGVFPGQ